MAEETLPGKILPKRPPGEPIRSHCTICGGDISEKVSYFQIQGQLAMILLLLCPLCKAPQVYGQSVLTVPGGRMS